METGVIREVEQVHTFGLEGLWVYGPPSIQAEAMAAVVDQAVQQTATLDGAYIQLGWFLTGEHRPTTALAARSTACSRLRTSPWTTN
jgi:phosphate-selective porin OprO/OprP